jgi:hypothetical protein
MSYTLSVKLSNFTVWPHTYRENWSNCAVLTGNSAGIRTVLSSRLSHRELRSSPRESHNFLSFLPTTRWLYLKAHRFLAIRSADEHRMIYSFSNTTSYILRFPILFSDNIMANVASKQQMTALFLCTIVTRKTRQTKPTKKMSNLMGNLCCASEHSVLFFVQFYLHS